MMLANTLQIPVIESIQRIFDLKGSTVNREVKMDRGTLRTKTLKDVNFMKLRREEPLAVPYIDFLFVTKQLSIDSDFLKSQGIMDYSLLLAIENSEGKRLSVSQILNSTKEGKSNISSASRHLSAISALTRDQIEQAATKNRHKLESEDGKMRYHIAVIDYL